MMRFVVLSLLVVWTAAIAFGRPADPATTPPDSRPLLIMPAAALAPDRSSLQPAAVDAWIDAVAAGVTDQSNPYEVIDACIAAEMAEVGAPGASIAVAVDGEIAYTHGYGVRHAKNGGAIDASTMFRIGSSTKMMTAAALMTLVDAGKLDLHAPITTYLPELRLPAPWDAGAITAHHLLSHSSGMSESYRMPSVALLNSVPLATWATRLLPLTAMGAPPGTFWNYSNPGYSLAGYLLERLSGMSHAEYTSQHVWAPAGMPLTTFSAADVMDRGNFAWGYRGGQPIAPDEYPMPTLAPAGMAFSTPTEMVTWALIMMNEGGAVLSPRSAATMQTPYVATDDNPWERYGYGIFIAEYEDRQDPSQQVTVYDHGGNTTGWGSQLYWVPARGVAVSILDSTMASLDKSAQCVLREVAGIAPRPTGGLTTEPRIWDAFVGTYAEMNQAQWDATIRVTRDGGTLLLHRLEADTVTPLVNVFGPSFKADADRNGRPDPATSGLTYTFSGDGTEAGPIRWLRNRIQISERVGQFPDSLHLQGTSCQPMPFTPEIDIPRL